MAIAITFALLEESELANIDREATSEFQPLRSGSFYAKPGILKFKSGVNSELISNKVKQTLSTLAFGPGSGGEIPWRAEFGTGISAMRFASLKDTLPAVISSFIRTALERWVPEVQLSSVGVKQDKERGLLTIRVVYKEVASQKVIAATVEVA